ncbi:hypothetical protein GQX73_g4468 [Xylaria multiplex]|uniref:T6SS Phospholipase effector Tle1-like catalytic domain-containing protein n=1 Tax=Xylaria multiplex TaxID=323545 RepID=A0A7C8N5W9_9PEZI|nr:hypothetical protein GQX73_g4468 [Xylaria multiplex]
MVGKLPTRLVICVDGTWFDPDGGNNKKGNITNIYRLYASVGKGEVQDETGNRFNQQRMYVRGIGSEDNISTIEKLYTGAFGLKCFEQIKNVYRECCRLTGPNDEVWLYGFSRGAYVARAVAGLLHHLRALSSADIVNDGDKTFNKDYKEALKVYEKLQKGEKLKGEGNLHHFFEGKTRPAPTIKFIGVFDTVKAVDDKSLYDISFNQSIQHMRAALALNEDRKAMRVEGLWPSWGHRPRSRSKRSFIQAWFVGTHTDIGGSTQMDGLALYPLQWMMLESKAKGLIFKFEGDYGGRALLENPLEIVGIEGNKNNAVFCMTENKVVVEMRDIDLVHDEGGQYGNRYAVKLRQTTGMLANSKETRMPFDDIMKGGGLKGYSPQGTILHPSVYLIIDKHLNLSLDRKLFPFYAEIEIWRHKMTTRKRARTFYVRKKATTIDLKISHAISKFTAMYKKLITRTSTAASAPADPSSTINVIDKGKNVVVTSAPVDDSISL